MAAPLTNGAVVLAPVDDHGEQQANESHGGEPGQRFEDGAVAEAGAYCQQVPDEGGRRRHQGQDHEHDDDLLEDGLVLDARKRDNY